MIFLELPDSQKTIHYLGIPYLVESSFRGRFYTVMTMEEEDVPHDIEDKVLEKYFTKNKLRKVI